ncbi:DUF1566 domain-containing protein [Alcanivorax sp.]|uniref:Lcl domain-containing protein n=1 Tax=Alcanivorax sp. TaxID=1872427 RepID=UPI0025BBE849|nr:DUF1566 domain-containing protein [Alcanivorax sp.]
MIVLGGQDYTVDVSTGDDVVIGGDGDNTYKVFPGSGQITLVEVAGSNTVEFQPGITFSDVASGLWTSGDDLRLVIGGGDQSLTVRDFFAVQDTITSFHFSNGETLSASQLFSVFGRPAPTNQGTQKTLVTEVDTNSTLVGSSSAEILVPDITPSTIQGLAGDDLIIGRAYASTFEFFPGDGSNTIIASSGMHVVRFSGGIQFNDVATQLQKSGDDLVLGNQTNNDQVRIHQFFSHSGIISSIEFESGGQLDAASLFQLFGVQAPTEERNFTLNVNGSVWEQGSNGGSSDDGGDDGDDGSGGNDGGDGGDDGGGGNPGGGLPEDPHYLVGTDGNDFIYVGEGDNFITSKKGSDFLVGGNGNNVYQFKENDRENVIAESAGYNYILFDQSVTYQDVASSFTSQQGNDDLILNISSKNLKITVKDFFGVENTISEIRLSDGQAIDKAQILQIFSLSSPSTQEIPPVLLLGGGAGPDLNGTNGNDLIIPRMGNRFVYPGSGNDILVASHRGIGLQNPPSLQGDYPVTFVFEPGDGANTVVSEGKFANVKFSGGIQYSDIASQFYRVGSDLVLKNDSHGVSVKVQNFFIEPKIIGEIWFDSQDEEEPPQSITGQEIYDLFESSPPAQDFSLAVLIKGGTTGSCHQDVVTGEGFGLTQDQLSQQNNSPNIISLPPLEAVFDKPFEYQVWADDPENNDLCYSLATAPEGVDLHSDSGRISWIPARDQIGEQTFVVVVTDERGAAVQQEFTLPVMDPVIPPIITSEPPSNLVVGEYFEYPVIIEELSHERDVFYNLLDGPPSMEFDDVVLKWKPDASAVGEHLVRVQVVDLYGLEDIKEFTLSVSPLVLREQTEEGYSRIPRTGSRVSISPYDDGGMREGTPRVFERDLANQVVIDKVNGLVWQDDASVLSQEVTRLAAKNYCQYLTHGGRNNWRLPNRLELVYLMDHYRGVSGGHYISSVFESVGSGYDGDMFHAENNNEQPSSRSFDTFVNFNNKRVLPSDSSIEGFVRCVSGDQKFIPEMQRLDNFSVVVDRENRLMWQDDQSVLSVAGDFNEAIQHCENLTVGGYEDWRLPNFNESHVLQREFEYYVEGGDESLFFKNVPDEPYWQSSTLVYEGSRYRFRYQYDSESNYPGSWVANLNFNSISIDTELPIRCVRSYGEPVPIVSPLGPISVNVNESVTLSAAGSFHVDGNIVQYEWREVSEDLVLGQSESVDFSFSEQGVYQVVLTVWDENGLSQTSSVPVEVAVYGPPEIAIEGSASIWSDETLTLDAGGSYDMAGIASYQWRSIDTDQVVSNSSSLVRGNLEAGNLVFELTVTNINGLSSIEEITVKVADRPEISIDTDESHYEGGAVILDASDSISHLNLQDVEWRDGQSGAILGSNSVLDISGLPVGSHVVVLKITDADGRVHEESVNIDIQAAPQPQAVLPQDYFVYEHSPIEIDGGESSVEHGDLFYEWRLNGELISESDILFIEEGLDSGEYQVELSVFSEYGTSDLAILNLSVDVLRNLAECPANPIEDDRSYEVRYPEDNVDWHGGSVESVDDIARAFNYARSQDPSVSQYLIMPNQSEWDAFSIQEKTLYIINAERAARGIKPYSGIDMDIVSVAQSYSEYIRSNNLIIDHYADGQSPQQRLDLEQYVETSRDSLPIKNESISSLSTSENMPTEEYAAVKSIYNWIYQDKDWFVDFEWANGPAWGHRDHLLQTGLNENHGSSYDEGLIGIGISRGAYAPGGDPGNYSGYVTVFNTVDEGPSWDSQRIKSIDVSDAQGCVTEHVITLDPASIDQQGMERIRIEPSTLLMTPGNQASIQLTGLYSGGQTVDLTHFAQFIPDYRSVVAVNNNQIQAVQIGRASVIARLGDLQSNSLHVHVQQRTDTSNIIGTPAESFLGHVPDNASIQAYDPKLLTRFTGSVKTKDGSSLSGVQVSFLNRPELGSTRTDSDGQFVIAGPAGNKTLVYEKPGYLVVQRRTVAPSNAWGNLETVTLLPRDSKRSHIDLSSGQTQVHQSSVINDESGSRKATVVFNDITQATIVSADGSQRNLDDFWFSATEFETPGSMPGALPKETAFTFANDLHVADTHYSDKVIFDGFVVMFVDNFLGFEVGEIIPIGYFDRLADEWVASPNGVVVKLVDSSGNGQFDGLDYTGDDQPDDLNGNGNTDDEITGLSQADYSPGDTLWWGAFDHMTPYDYNFAPSDAEPPIDLEVDVDEEKEHEDDCAETGSFCMLHQRSFHEAIPVTGTNQSLHYHSQRTDGYEHVIRIKASGDEVSGSLEGIIVQLDIGGHQFEQRLPAEHNQEAEFVWDGYNIDGTRSSGDISGRVRIGYEYRRTYASSGNAAVEGASLDEFPRFWATLGDRATQVPGRRAFVAWKDSSITLRNTFPGQIAEGWSLSGVHESGSAGKIYLGSGGVQSYPSRLFILKTGQSYSFVDGDDGYYQSGGSVSDYGITEIGTLIDNVTGLEWQFFDEPQLRRTRNQAAAYCEMVDNFWGGGWRLPTPKEVGYTATKGGGAVSQMIYDPSRSLELWNQLSANPDEAPKPVLCVKGQVLDQRYIERLARDDTRGVVVDQGNALMWQDAPENSSLKLNWNDSIAHCEASEYAGYDDWRLPNINELLYVLPNDIFVHQTELDLPEGELWSAVSDYRQVYWSSTTNHNDDTQAWGIESESYNSPLFNKSDLYHVRCIRQSSTAAGTPFIFDIDGRHQATIDTDSGKTLSTFKYDDEGRLESIIDRFGRATLIERDTFGKPTQIVSPDGHITTLNIDENNHLRQVGYEDGGSFDFDYLPDGLLTEKSDPKGNVHVREYNPRGRLLETRNPEEGRWVFYNQHLSPNEDHYGYVTAESRQYHVERTRLENGDSQWLTQYPSGVEKTRRLTPDALQERIEENGVITLIDNVLDTKTKRPRPSQIQQELPSGLTRTVTVDRQYAENGADTARYTEITDLNGKVSTLEVNARTGLTRMTSAEGRVTERLSNPDTLLPQQVEAGGLLPTTFDYDSEGRLVGLSRGTGVDQRQTSLAYDGQGNLDTLTDAMSRTTEFEHDAMGRITKQTFPDGREVSYDYDVNGNLVSLTPPGRDAHVFSYDGIDQETAYTPPEVTEGQTVTRYHYNRDRDLTRIERPDNREVVYGYNAGGQLEQVTLERGITTYQYQAQTGNLSQITTPEGNALTYQWDGTLPTGQSWQGDINGTVSQTWDPHFWLSQRCVNSTNCASFGYDDDGLLTQVGDLTLTRDVGSGLLTGTALGILAQSHTYNDFGERTATTLTESGSQIGTMGYSHDKLGRITSRSESLPGSSLNDSYDYNQAGYLVSAARNGATTTWQYDSNGNRTHENGAQIATYDEQDRLLSYQGATYSHTKNGERQSKTESGATTTYQYDELGNLLTVTLPGDMTIEYVIDGQNRRIGKKVNGTLTQGFLYQDQLNPIAELDGSGNITARFIYGDKRNVPAYMEKDGNTYRIISDHLGSPRLVIDTATGDVAQRMTYDVWGNITEDTNPGFQPFGFAGGIYDQHTGLTRFGARDYDAETGRWTAKDPIRFEGKDQNLYGYVLNDPINLFDLDGNLPSLPQGLVDFSAGLGDGLLLGFGDELRELTDVSGGVDPCSSSYKVGGWTSFAAGGARLAYAGMVKGGSMLASSGAAASEFRNSVKAAFRLGLGKNWRKPNLSKYNSDAALRAASGRSNPAINTYGAGVAAAGADGGTN